jgi:formylmethanofuran dehydrogenase subunit D
MGAIDLGIEKRKEHIDGEQRPLHTTERTVNEQVENCYYCNIPRRVAERMGLEGGTTVKVDEYRDRVVIRREEV